MLDSNLRPPLDTCEPPELNDLISRSWMSAPEQRMSMDALSTALSNTLTTTMNPSQKVQ